MAYPGGMHRVWAIRRAWRVRLWLAAGLALLLLPLALLVHPAWVLASLLGLLYPTRWEEPRALAELDRRYGLAYRSALEAPLHHPWRSQLQAEAEASLREARPPNWPWVLALAYLALVGMAWVLPPLHWPSAAPPVVADSPSGPGDALPQNGGSASSPPPPNPGLQTERGPEEAPPAEKERVQGAADQNQTQNPAAQDAARTEQTAQSSQDREQPAPNTVQSPQNTPTGQPQPNQTGQATNPAEQSPPTSQPGQAQPRQPGQAQPAQPGQVQPQQPGQARPQQPGQTQPPQTGSQGEQAPPAPGPRASETAPQPGQTQPAQPGQAQPQQPGPQPGQGQASGQSQPRGEQGSGQVTNPPLRPPTNAQRPAGEAPLGRGENRQGRPQPLPSPWPSGQPPQNVQRQAEKYLESEPLPPEVRDLLRRYFELPQR